MYEKLVKMLFSQECNVALSGKHCMGSISENTMLRYREKGVWPHFPRVQHCAIGKGVHCLIS